MILKVGDKAPDFTLDDQNGKEHHLSDLKGRWVLLYFYPKDDTPGCTKEACGLRDNFSQLSKQLTILGVSADSVASHKKFEEKYHLPFTLLSDPEKKVIDLYGTNGILFTKRTSFLINSEGIINKIYEKVKPEMHAKEILEDIAVLEKAS